MIDDRDPRIADLLREDAPPERDPMFRVAVLERIERARHRRRLQALLGLGVALAVIAVLGAGAGGATREAAGVLLIGAALASAYFILAPAVTQLLARFRG